MADAFGEILAVDNTLVRKWGRLLIAVEDHSAAAPTTFFASATKTPILPAGAKQLGFITTDAVTLGRSISSTDTNMLQTLAPVRSDLESDVSTIACAFGEASNAWVQAVWAGLPVSEFPASAKAAWSMPIGEVSEFPEYRIHLIGVDGRGDRAVYRYIYGYRAKVTATTDRTLGRSNPETIGFTFSLLYDAAAGKTYEQLENGPFYGTN